MVAAGSEVLKRVFSLVSVVVKQSCPNRPDQYLMAGRVLKGNDLGELAKVWRDQQLVKRVNVVLWTAQLSQTRLVRELAAGNQDGVSFVHIDETVGSKNFSTLLFTKLLHRLKRLFNLLCAEMLSFNLHGFFLSFELKPQGSLPLKIRFQYLKQSNDRAGTQCH